MVNGWDWIMEGSGSTPDMDIKGKKRIITLINTKKENMF